jgi:hypothetical protein
MFELMNAECNPIGTGAVFDDTDLSPEIQPAKADRFML